MSHPRSESDESTGGSGSLPEPVAERASSAAASGDYRDELGSRRWNAAPLRNPEAARTDPRIAVAAILILCLVTLLVLVAGYASGFWQLPEASSTSGAVAALELLA
jgi:hypothetical protein